LARTKAGVKLPVTAYDSSGTIKLDTGVFSTFDNQINTTTGTIEARSIFPNAKFVLYPNQFVNVDLLVDTLHNADIVPTSAIERGAPGTYVYVVQPNNTVAVQAVKLGPADGQRQAILSGLKPGQVVVTDGADRLKAGAKITEAPPTPTTAAATPAAATPAATPAGATTPSSTAPGATGPGATAVGPNSPPATTPPATTPVGAPPPAAAPAAAVPPATALPATALPARTPAATTPAGAAPPAATPVPAATPNAPGTALQSVTPPPERTHHRRRKPASSDDGSSE
jgi:multidrug efflux system membrane fusion protein